MKTLLALAMLTLSACTAGAQDTFIPTHGKAACEFWSGTDCARVGRPRTRIVRVPVTTQKLMRHVPEHLAPLHSRRPEVRGWRHGEDRMPQCLYERFTGLSDEKVMREGEKQAMSRWSAAVGVRHGALYISWENAIDRRVRCFQSSAGDRMTDRAIGAVTGAARAVGDALRGRERDDDDKSVTHTRCEVSARPCLAPIEYVKPRDAEPTR